MESGPTDTASVQVREARVLELILSGVKKKKSFRDCKLEYKPGGKDYRRICRAAGKYKGCS